MSKAEGKTQAVKTAKLMKGTTKQKVKKVRTQTRFFKPKTKGPISKPKVEKKAVRSLPRMDKYTVIKNPLTTESAMKMIEEQNTLVFLCDRRSNKPSIKAAVQSLYDVKVAKVNTLNRPDNVKKAYVKLHKDFDALDVANRIGII